MWVTATGWGHLEVSHLEVEYLRGVPPEKEERVIYQNRYWQAWGDSDVDMYFYVFPASYCYWPHHWGYICYQYDPYWYWYTWRPYYYREIVVVHHIYIYHYCHRPHYHYYDCDCDYNGGPLVSVGAPKGHLATVGSPREPLARIGGSSGAAVDVRAQPNSPKKEDKIRVWKQPKISSERKPVREYREYIRPTTRKPVREYREYIRPKPTQKPQKEVRKVGPKPKTSNPNQKPKPKRAK